MAASRVGLQPARSSLPALYNGALHLISSMSEFELVSIVLSFILGLGVAQILSSLVYLIHSRRETRLRWTPFLWAVAILLFHLNFLFAALWFYYASGSLELYFLDLFSAVLLFLSGGLILPSASRSLPLDLNEFFERDGRLALLPLSIFLAMSVPYNVQGGLPLLGRDNIIVGSLLVLAAVAYLGKGRVREASTVIFAVLTTYAFLFVFARPGVTPG